MKYRRAKHVLEHSAALDTSIEWAVRVVQEAEAAVDVATERCDAFGIHLPAARAELEQAELVLAEAQRHRDVAAAHVRVHANEREEAEHDVAVRTEELMRARAEAGRLFEERTRLEPDLAEALARVDRAAAAKEERSHGRDCPHCHRKETVISPIKISIAKVISGVGTDLQIAKRAKIAELSRRLSDAVAEKEGVPAPVPPGPEISISSVPPSERK